MERKIIPVADLHSRNLDAIHFGRAPSPVQFYFHAVFGKFWPNNRLVSPLQNSGPPLNPKVKCVVSTHPYVPDCDASPRILDEHPQDEILAALADVPSLGKPNLVH